MTLAMLDSCLQSNSHVTQGSEALLFLFSRSIRSIRSFWGKKWGVGEGGWNLLLLTLTLKKGTGGAKVSSQVRESKFRNPGLFCCGIKNPELWNPEYGSRNPAQARDPLTIGILNPSSTDKESSIRNPWSGIQNLLFPCRERLVIWDRVFTLFSFVVTCQSLLFFPSEEKDRNSRHAKKELD